MKKTIYTLNIGGYNTRITDITYPFIRYYANKIGADFHIITEKKFPGWPPVYEKLQIYELAQKHGNDWNIFVDSDCLIHPETIDWTEHIPKDTVAQNGSDFANIRWKYDRFFRRDGRHIGTCNWFSVFSDWCIEMMKPCDDMSLDEILTCVSPTTEEYNFGMVLGHFVDDYVISRNIAKYGIKYTTFKKILKDLTMENAEFFFHLYTVSENEKVAFLKKTVAAWKLERYLPQRQKELIDPIPNTRILTATNNIDGWMQDAQLGWLYDKARVMDSVVEIGSWRGRSTHALLSACKGTVTAVDHFKGTPGDLNHEGGVGVYEDFLKNVGGFKNLKVLKMDSRAAAASLNGQKFDMVFIDGDHSYAAVKADIDTWLPRCTKLICGHDYDNDYPDVKKAVLERFGLAVKEANSIWYVPLGEKEGGIE